MLTDYERAEAQYLDESRFHRPPEHRCSVCLGESDRDVCEECGKDSMCAVDAMKSTFEKLNELIK